MKIILADHYGICFGVRDAIAEAHRLASNGPLSVLGELVHNPVVRHQLTDLGVHEVPLDQVGAAPTAQVMITAHGASDSARAAWRRAGYGVADGTCPLVRHAHEQLRTLVEMGYTPVVIGKRGHVEVQGLTGDFPNAAVIETEEQVCELPESPRYGVISQTTQPLERVRQLINAIRTAHPLSEVLFRDTICQPTKRRQEALRTLLTQVDTLVVVGGRNRSRAARPSSSPPPRAAAAPPGPPSSPRR